MHYDLKAPERKRTYLGHETKVKQQLFKGSQLPKKVEVTSKLNTIKLCR